MALRNNKKGSIVDVIHVMVILLVFAMMLLIGFKVMDEINTKFQESDALDAMGKEASQRLTGMYPGVMDNSFLFLMIGLFLVTIILAFLVAFHPVFFIFYFIFLTIVIFIAGIASNIYQEAAANAELASIAAQLTYTSHILEFLPIILGIFGFIVAIVSYRTYSLSA